MARSLCFSRIPSLDEARQGVTNFALTVPLPNLRRFFTVDVLPGCYGRQEIGCRVGVAFLPRRPGLARRAGPRAHTHRDRRRKGERARRREAYGQRNE